MRTRNAGMEVTGWGPGRDRPALQVCKPSGHLLTKTQPKVGSIDNGRIQGGGGHLGSFIPQAAPGKWESPVGRSVSTLDTIVPTPGRMGILGKGGHVLRPIHRAAGESH